VDAEELLAAERHTALRQAFTQLSPQDQRLIAVLIAHPPVPYAEISARLGIPIGSIGPTRSRCLDRMRRSPAIAALINVESGSPCLVRNTLYPYDNHHRDRARVHRSACPW
jgi:hypothetical protein